MTQKQALQKALDEIQKNLTEIAVLKSEIERLKGLVRYHCEEQMKGWKTERELKAKIEAMR